MVPDRENDALTDDRLTDRDREILQAVVEFCGQLPFPYREGFVDVVYAACDRGLSKGALHGASEYREMKGTILTELKRYKEKLLAEGTSAEYQLNARETH